jgi:hypothetical protein
MGEKIQTYRNHSNFKKMNKAKLTTKKLLILDEEKDFL